MSDNPFGWSNGYVPDDFLTTVQGSLQLRNDVAGSWNQMKSAAAAGQVSLMISPPAGAYRSYATQKDMTDNPQKYDINPGVKLAAPGSSTHGFGTCADIYTASGNNWMIRNASAYSWVRDLYPQSSAEANHWHYVGNTTPVSRNTTPPPPPVLEDEMLLITATNLSGTPTFLLTPGRAYPFIDGDDLNVFLGGHPSLTVHPTGTLGRYTDPNQVLVSLFANYGITLTSSQIAALPRGQTYKAP